jgi:hypothetical protein
MDFVGSCKGGFECNGLVSPTINLMRQNDEGHEHKTAGYSPRSLDQKERTQINTRSL